VLEYYKWFQSRLKLQAAAGVMPLGGNTVFFRREFLEALRARYGSYWDDDCLTEDCKIGMVASVLGYEVGEFTRQVAPLKPAPDAQLLDSTGLSIDDVVERVLSLGRERGLWP
jgi:hypothetical protein